MKSFLKNRGIYVVIILAILFAASPVFTRLASGHPAIPGGESYYNMRIAHEILQNPLLETDPLQQRAYNFNLYHYFLAALLLLTSTDQTLVVFSIMISLVTVMLLFKSLKNMGMTKDKIVLAIGAYVLTPLYSYMASSLTTYTLSMFLLALSLYLYSSRSSPLALLPASLITLTDPLVFIMFFAAAMIYAYYADMGYKEPFILLIGGVAVASILIYLTGYVPSIELGGGVPPRNYITDFGAVIGYPFFALLLAAVAVVMFWKKDIKTKATHMLLLLLIFFSASAPSARIVMNLALCIYAALGISHFINRKWSVQMLRDLTLLILFSSLLFSGMSFYTRLATMEPSEDTVAALEALSFENRPGLVLSSEENGFLIEYYAQKPAYLDGLSFSYPGYEEKIDAAWQIYHSSTPSKTREELSDNNITYIYIDPAMKEALWGHQRELLLVLEVSETFIKIVEFQGKEDWLFIRI